MFAKIPKVHALGIFLSGSKKNPISNWIYCTIHYFCNLIFQTKKIS